MNGILTTIGEKLSLNCQLAVFGKLQIDSIEEETFGVTSGRLFKKMFKYSKDNLDWSDWDNFTLQNMQKLNGKEINVLFLNFSYERIGDDEEGVLQLINISFSGNMIITINDYSTTSKSIFADLIENDTFTVSIANNLLKKIYEYGIIPNFVERGNSESNDFIDFWSAVCTFFSYMLGLANKFDNILNDKDYLSEYVSQRNMTASKDNMTLSDIQFIANNFLSEVSKRGTKNILLEKGHEFLDGNSAQIDGEWIRLLSKNKYDEFLVEFVKKEHCGYFMDKSSFLYNGTNLSAQINKAPENTGSFTDLDKFPFANQDLDYYEIVEDDNETALKVTPVEGENVFGIGFSEVPKEVEAKYLINIDNSMDYEFTFMIKKELLAPISTNKLKIGILGFNLNNFHIPDSFLNLQSDVPQETFYEEDFTKRFTTSNWYFIRCFIHAKQSFVGDQLSADMLDVNALDSRFGFKSLKFNHTEVVSKVMPYIQLIGDDGACSMLIKDYKFRPLIRGKNVLSLKLGFGKKAPISSPYIKNPSFVQNNSSVISWMKNNSDKSDLFVRNFIENYLLPYQKQLYEIQLVPKLDDKQLLT